MVSRFAIVVLFVAVLALAGCGGVRRTHVSGKVTYKGTPVAYGQITFSPEKGAIGSAPIRDGAYDTRRGDGPGPGPGVARVEGFDGQATPDQPLGTLLFFFEEQVDLPTSASVKDFTVSESAPKAPPERKQAIVP